MLRSSILGLLTLLTPCALGEDLPADLAGAPVVLTLDLTGRVPTRCGFASAPASTADFGDLAVAGSLALPFTLDCNAPFQMKVASSNGALTRTEPVAAPDLYSTRVTYGVALSFNTDLGSAASACTSLALAQPVCALKAGLSSGDGVAMGTDGALKLSWTPPEKTLVAGSYADQITLTVEVRS